MGLVLKVKVGDRLVVNGAVLRNAGRNQMMIEVENQSDVLRAEEIFSESMASTPVRRLCHQIQIAMVSRESRGELIPRIHAALDELESALGKSQGQVLRDVRVQVEKTNLYGAYRLLLPVITYEDELLAMASDDEPEGIAS
ncbi:MULTISPECIES: flagellar biosynthesis repressor FlbT [Rhodobacterales]|uniref:flagellar biosynthesis repressor FlbT n=1 Tax=Roseobacter sp. N2S TaxID=2663844 RepID=UPI0028546D1E|nr:MULTISPECIES: flagellar biosynthesis repressor FlbT [Rhodobacterales]MDR6266756.1 flagellar protein FlbT [Roseobacter sp. N2S]